MPGRQYDAVRAHEEMGACELEGVHRTRGWGGRNSQEASTQASKRTNEQKIGVDNKTHKETHTSTDRARAKETHIHTQHTHMPTHTHLLHCLVAATLDTLLPSRMRYVTFLSLSSWLHALDYPSLALSLSRSLASSPAFPLALGLSLGLGPANINNNGDNKRSMNEDDDPLSSVSVARAL